jgi:uncharacterized YccA/Bax inhibitor family protein
MALFQSGNPTLTDKAFNNSKTINIATEGSMTVKGTMNKFGFLMLLVLGSAAYTWQLMASSNPSLLNILMWVGLIAGFVTAIVISFKPVWSQYLAPAYAIFEGLFLGAVSVIINEIFSEKYPNIILQAIGLTIGVAIAMYLLYSFKIIQPTQRFKSILFSATLGIGIFYLITIVLRMFGIQLGFMQFGDNSILGIGISLFVVAIASLNLILDFERIEVGSKSNAPKFMEWYGAFGLLVTIVWLYLEILKLLSRFASKD